MISRSKERYDRLKMQGICPGCGKRKPYEGRVYCSECNARQRNEQEKTKSVFREMKKTPERKKPPKYSLEEIAAMAREQGMSYGQFVVLMDGKGGGF